MDSSAYYEKCFGINMRGNPPHQCARITNVSRFSDMSWWFWITPGLQSSIFGRVGFHVTVWAYMAIGISTFSIAMIALGSDDRRSGIEDINYYETESTKQMMAITSRLLTLVLSAYLIQIIKTYHIGIRAKSRNMMYGCSKVVDCLSATIDYTHENASAVLSSLHRALTAIGHHALNTSSGAEIDTKLATFEERGLDSQYLLKLPPKQTLHVLRLAVLQTIVKERRYEEGCLVSMTDEDFAVLRGDLNDYCGGASSTGTTSSKLPFCYFQIVNWAVKVLSFFYIANLNIIAAQDWYQLFHSPGVPTPGVLAFSFAVFFCFFQMTMLYFLFVILECYRSVNQIWQSGLVLDNYHGIIDLICQPLERAEAPMDVEQLSKNR